MVKTIIIVTSVESSVLKCPRDVQNFKKQLLSLAQIYKRPHFKRRQKALFISREGNFHCFSFRLSTAV